ncbi:MAG: Ni/Fe hydrogenase subunit alpha [Polyangia bacterium]|jgi:NAD-reducing hydrogenase large subunit
MAERRKVVIDPVTRVEGHAKITLHLDEQGKVAQARFHTQEFRGFEKFCEGRLWSEMPGLTARICGICPHSHAIASAKAGEAIMGVAITPTAEKLRRMIQLGQFISSHALSFFHLSAPDLLLGFDADPETRNLVGLADKFPEIVRRGIRLRQFGQEISERITGKRIHVMGICAGGMLYGLGEQQRRALLGWYPEVVETAVLALDICKSWLADHTEAASFAAAQTLFMALVGPDGAFEPYHGRIRVIDPEGRVVAGGLDPEDYLSFIAEKPVSWSYLKYPYYRPLGEEHGVYRVGPLARLNVISHMTTPRAQQELDRYRARSGGKPVHGALYAHYARLIEVLAAVELISELLEDADITGTDLMVAAGRNRGEGIGCTEAPRGILFHHYQVDQDGRLAKVNLLIATGQNNPSMDRAIFDVARQYVDGNDLREGALNRVEAAIRCYDPCLSCATHALGTLPLTISVVDAAGRVLTELARNQPCRSG